MYTHLCIPGSRLGVGEGDCKTRLEEGLGGKNKDEWKENKTNISHSKWVWYSKFQVEHMKNPMLK